MIIGYATIYYYNPHLKLDDILEPVLNKIENKLPIEYPTVFVSGIFTYKFITIALSYLTG
jgi:hypothetical protein